jgi:dodecin
VFGHSNYAAELSVPPSTAREFRSIVVTAGPEDNPCRNRRKSEAMSVYRVTEVIGVSEDSWEAAAREAVATAAATVRDLRVAEVVREDVTIENGAVTGFRVRLAISFKYESGA